MLFADRYRVLRRLGSGGMATVFLAEDCRLGRQVAVKRLEAAGQEEAIRRFEREARLGAGLNHPNIVQIYDTARDGEGVLIVMEYVEGPTLQQALAERRFDPAESLEVLRGVATALDHAHEQGVLHRDVKPANILLRRDGTVKVADLGIATAAEVSQITPAGTLLGTPTYLAPELFSGESATRATDVYAVAAVAFEMLSGRKIQSGATPLEVAYRVTTQPAPDLREAWPAAPEEASEVLRRALARDPAERPASAGELVGALEAALAAEPSTEATAVAASPAPVVAPSSAPVAPSSVDTEQPEPATGLAAGHRAAEPTIRWSGRASAPSSSVRSDRRRGRLAAAAALVLVAAAAGVVTVGFGPAGDGEDGAPPTGGERRNGERRDGERSPAVASPAPARSGETPEEAVPGPGGEPLTPDGSAETPTPDPAEGRRLNDQGFALVEQGSYDEAVPVLERAVQLFPPDTDDLGYAYALYNLGRALRLSGRPEEAIPVLERRARIPNQLDVVQRELEAARRDAGS